MHPFEVLMVSTLEQGKEPSIAQFGDVFSLRDAAPVIGKTRLMPEFLRLALTFLPDTTGEENSALGEFVCLCIENAFDDFVLIEALELLGESRPLRNGYEERCFAHFLILAADRTVLPMARAAALDGAFRWAITNRRRELRLLDLLLGVTPGDDPIFLARAAKIIGVAYSHWQNETELVAQLELLAMVEGVQDEAAFELGLSQLADGLKQEDQAKAMRAFEDARRWFLRASEHREQRPDADAYSHCLDVLLAFSRGDEPSKLQELSLSLLNDAFQMAAWHRGHNNNPWLGARHAEEVCWNMLALNLSGLAAHLEEISWWEPAVVVERFVIASFSASRSILKLSSDGGIETLVQPRIIGMLAQKEGQALQVKNWLRHNTDHAWAAEARDLSQRIDTFVREERHAHPYDAAAIHPAVAALIEESGIPATAKSAALSALASVLQLNYENTSGTVMALIEDCSKAVADFPDYRDNPDGKILFDAVLYFTIKFLCSRLEITRRDDPGVAYLFEQEDGSLPHESKLQLDYFHMLYPNVPGVEIEISNISGGRVDVRFRYRGEQLVTEVKRNNRDCSLEALKRLYGAQTTDYQNVNIRLGFMLVLDQTQSRTEGTPHISSLVHPTTVVREGEDLPRCVVIVRVPGRRFVPSALTKEAEKSQRKSSRGKRAAS